MLVKKLEQGEFNVIIVYKPRGEKTIIGPKMHDDIDISNDIFAVGIQTRQQKEMFEKQANKIVCIDAIHKTNQYEFPLVNILVPDEFNKSLPVGHLICNRADELVMTPLFAAIKSRCKPDIQINSVMTDDDNGRFNALEKVFSDCSQLLCK